MLPANNTRPNASMTSKTETLKNQRQKITFFSSCLKVVALLVLLFVGIGGWAAAQRDSVPRFRVVAIAEKGGIHLAFVQAAKVWLNDLAAKDGFAIDYIEDTTPIDDAFLAKYQLFIQLNYPPYGWTPTAQAAFIKYI